MSHLLYLNGRDNHPNKCPHICLHQVFKQRLLPLGRRQLLRTCLSKDAYYTHHRFSGNKKFLYLARLFWQHRKYAWTIFNQLKNNAFPGDTRQGASTEAVLPAAPGASMDFAPHGTGPYDGATALNAPR
jgi:hypothetical protein